MRLLLFYLILLSFQGFVGALIAPLPGPDFFLLMALTPIRRLNAWQMVLIAYGIGLLQDLIGHGIFGMHAFALAVGIFMALLIKGQFSQGFFAQILLILTALLGKWMAMTAIIYWLNPKIASDSFQGIMNILPYEVVFTLVVGIFILPWSESLMQKVFLARGH